MSMPAECVAEAEDAAPGVGRGVEDRPLGAGGGEGPLYFAHWSFRSEGTSGSESVPAAVDASEREPWLKRTCLARLLLLLLLLLRVRGLLLRVRGLQRLLMLL